MCGDYRELNHITKADLYSMPAADENFDRMEGAVIFSTLDMRQGFNQIVIKEEDKCKTAFHGVDGYTPGVSELLQTLYSQLQQESSPAESAAEGGAGMVVGTRGGASEKGSAGGHQSRNGTAAAKERCPVHALYELEEHGHGSSTVSRGGGRRTSGSLCY
ncbi:hypothetical protein CLOP_g6285 [Closterium sp. NIES-67]|nr:hypothetical protein CLOP_g6285 [Closterium sp. NIES-67]